MMIFTTTATTERRLFEIARVKNRLLACDAALLVDKHSGGSSRGAFQMKLLIAEQGRKAADKGELKTVLCDCVLDRRCIIIAK